MSVQVGAAFFALNHDCRLAPHTPALSDDPIRNPAGLGRAGSAGYRNHMSIAPLSLRDGLGEQSTGESERDRTAPPSLTV